MNSAQRNLTVAPLLAVLTFGMLALSACSPPNKDAGSPAAVPKTDWKEGYGGDSIAIEVVRHLETICFRTRTMRKPLLSSALETDKDVAAEICSLLEPNALTVEPIEQPLVKGVKKDAANYPNSRPRRLEIKRDFWTKTASSTDQRESLLLHEILPLVGLDDADYVRSTRMLVALEAKENKIKIASCDERRIEAMFAAGDDEFLKYYTKDFGVSRCAQVINVLKRHVITDNFGADLSVAIQHYYLWGIFTELVRAKTSTELDTIATLMRLAMTSLPAAFRGWNSETCADITTFEDAKPKVCGNILNVIASASARLKYVTAHLNTRSYDDDFERAAVHFMNLIRSEPIWEPGANPLLRDDQLAGHLVQSAIEGQNWVILFHLGRLQKKLNPELRPSDVLLRDINFQAVQRRAPTGEIGDGIYSPFVANMKNCLPQEIRNHASSILDGAEINNLMCGSQSHT